MEMGANGSDLIHVNGREWDQWKPFPHSSSLLLIHSFIHSFIHFFIANKCQDAFAVTYD